MKRTFRLIIVLFMILSISACNGIDTPEAVFEKTPLHAYISEIGDGALIDFDAEIRYENIEVNLREQYKAENEGKTITNIFGYEVDEMKFSYALVPRNHDNIYFVYRRRDEGIQLVYVDSITGEIDSMMFTRPFKEYELTDPINIETALERAREFVDTFYGHRIDLNEYTLHSSTTLEGYGWGGRNEYYFMWRKCHKEIIVCELVIGLDAYGNLVNFDFRDQSDYMDKLPDCTKEEYLEACRTRIEELYAQKGRDVEITNLSIDETEGCEMKSVYRYSQNQYCVKCRVNYDAIDPDGRERSSYIVFVFPYAEKAV